MLNFTRLQILQLGLGISIVLVIFLLLLLLFWLQPSPRVKASLDTVRTSLDALATTQQSEADAIATTIATLDALNEIRREQATKIAALETEVSKSPTPTHTPTATPGPDVCPEGCTYTSIQAAVNAADNGDTITIGSGTYRENVLINKKNLTLNGDRGGGTIVDGNDADVVFVNAVGKTVMNDLWITHGKPGIVNLSDLTLNGVTLHDNRVDSDYIVTGASSIEGIIGGGGIVSRFGSVMVINSTISENKPADSESRRSIGGGILILEGTLTLSNSTMSGNKATVGGGIYLNGSIQNKTPMGIHNSTIYNNTAFIGGGGIFTDFSGDLILNNSILAGNMAESGGTECLGTIKSEGYNLIQNIDDFCTVITMTSDLIGFDPLIKPLADNGGPTFTHALRLVSPALNKGGNDCPATDQRGKPRNDGRCDRGAFEAP